MNSVLHLQAIQYCIWWFFCWNWMSMFVVGVVLWNCNQVNSSIFHYFLPILHQIKSSQGQKRNYCKHGGGRAPASGPTTFMLCKNKDDYSIRWPKVRGICKFHVADWLKAKCANVIRHQVCKILRWQEYIWAVNWPNFEGGTALASQMGRGAE